MKAVSVSESSVSDCTVSEGRMSECSVGRVPGLGRIPLLWELIDNCGEIVDLAKK